MILTHLSGKNTEPKTLEIVLSTERLPYYGRLLQSMWSRTILDFTVFEIVLEESSIVNHLGAHLQNFVVVHQYNPFTNFYTKKNYS